MYVVGPNGGQAIPHAPGVPRWAVVGNNVVCFDTPQGQIMYNGKSADDAKAKLAAWVKEIDPAAVFLTA